MRTEQRKGFDENGRITLLETDADKCDKDKADLKGSLDRMTWVLVGVLISVATACIMYALDMAAGRAGGS